MASFEMHDFKALINIGQVGTGTLEGRITDLRVEEFVYDEKDKTMKFMDNSVIRTDSIWRIKLEWELAGSALEPDILAIKGAWVVKAYLEGWGRNADELDLPGDSVTVDLMANKKNGNSRAKNSTDAAWLYDETITIDPKKVNIKEGAYRLALTVTYEKKPGEPGPMAGFVEFDTMIQIYQPK